MNSIDIIVVSWNGKDDTLRALEAISAQERPRGIGQIRTVLVDNGSSDGTAEAVRERFPDVLTVRQSSNRGFTGGVAAGIDATSGDAIILVNNDAVPEPGWLAALTSALAESDPDVAAVGGLIVDPTGALADFARGSMTFDGHAFQPGFRYPLPEVDVPPAGSMILFACGGNMIARRAAWSALGGFDGDYFAYLEDVDFGWRAWLAGWRVAWEPAAVVRHRSSATSEKLGSFERGVLFERNALQTIIKNFDDERWAAALAPALLTLLHRTHFYTTRRNQGTWRLTRPNLDEAGSFPPPRDSLLTRLLRKGGLRRVSRSTVIEDDLTIMQFRALDWLFRNADRLMVKRAAVQRLRRRSDAEILERFPLLVVPTYPGDEELMASPLFRQLVRNLPTRDSTLDQIMKR
ncbi:MAG TPA: glycosyltransferase family 2 protein [Thermoanaerobaculia bacterium]|nr:glycosyltransferase family 2 protein [Thermoanaerobaculia bacterium]